MINDRKEEEMIAEIASELNETMSMMYNLLFNVQNAGSNFRVTRALNRLLYILLFSFMMNQNIVSYSL